MVAINASDVYDPEPVIPLVSDQVEKAVRFVLLISASFFICLFGVVANVINILVYNKQGIKDSITVYFLCLSASDLSFCVFQMTGSVCQLIDYRKPDWTLLDAYSFMMILTPPRTKVYAISVLVTMLLSAERCCCVVLPFKVKSLFTKRRAVYGVTIVSLGCLSWLVPEFLTVGLRWTFDSTYNKTRLLYWTAESRIIFEVPLKTVFGYVLPVAAMCNMTLCALLMISALRKSSKVRRSSFSRRVPVNPQSVTERSNAESMESHRATTSHGASTSHEASTSHDASTAKSQSKESPALMMSSKEAKVARTVIAVDLLFIVCNIPKCIVSGFTIASFFRPEIDDSVSERYTNLKWLIVSAAYTSESVNASVNLLIYYFANQKFRSTLRHIFGRRNDEFSRTYNSTITDRSRSM